MSKNNPNYVTAVKPKVGGAVFVAPVGTELPADAVTELSDAYKNLGHITEDGVPQNTDKSSDSVKDWNGDGVLNLDSGVTNSWKIGLMETLNPEVLKLQVGDANVSGTYEEGLSWSDGGNDQTPRVYVIDTLVKDGVSRLVIPRGVITAIDTIENKKTAARTLPVTVTGYVDENGKSFYGYAKKLAATE